MTQEDPERHPILPKQAPDSEQFWATIAEGTKAVKEFSASRVPMPFAAGDILIEKGASRNILGLVVSGLVRVEGFFQPVPDAIRLGVRDTTVFFVGDHAWMGLEVLHASPNVLSYVALTEGEAILLTREEAYGVLQGPLLMAALRQSAYQVGEFARDASSRHAHLGLRVISQLIRLRRLTAREEIPVTLKEIAELTGSSHSRVSPVMGVLEERGFIRRGRQRYLLTNKLLTEPAIVWETLRELAGLDPDAPAA